LFAFNHGDAMVTLPAAGVDLLSGREVTGTLALAAGDVAVVRELAAE
jgi:beta-galactosidase